MASHKVSGNFFRANMWMLSLSTVRKNDFVTTYVMLLIIFMWMFSLVAIGAAAPLALRTATVSEGRALNCLFDWFQTSTAQSWQQMNLLLDEVWQSWRLMFHHPTILDIPFRSISLWIPKQLYSLQSRSWTPSGLPLVLWVNCWTCCISRHCWPFPRHWLSFQIFGSSPWCWASLLYLLYI